MGCDFITLKALNTHMWSIILSIKIYTRDHHSVIIPCFTRLRCLQVSASSKINFILLILIDIHFFFSDTVCFVSLVYMAKIIYSAGGSWSPGPEKIEKNNRTREDDRFNWVWLIVWNGSITWDWFMPMKS